MQAIRKIISFYWKPFLLITAINFVLYFSLGSYFEDYEGIFSTFLQGTYSKKWSLELDLSSHFLLLYVYEWIVSFFPDYNIYGIILFLYNWLSLTFLGVILYRILKVNINKYSTLLFVLLYGIITIDNFVNLSSTRESIVFITAILCYIESCRFEGKIINIKKWVVLCVGVLFSALIRLEAALLCCLIYTVILFLNKRIKVIFLLPLLFSVLVFSSFYTIAFNTFKESKQIFVLKERELFDRDNVDYSRLTDEQLLSVKAIKQYGITDIEHFTLKFYDDISKTKTNRGGLSLLDGIRVDSFINTLTNSMYDFFSAKYLILYYLLSCILIVIYLNISKRSFLLYTAILFLIPVVICSYIAVPLRFLFPYFTIVSTLNILNYAKKRQVDFKLLTVLAFVFMLFLYNSILKKNNYTNDNIKYNETAVKLFLLANETKENQPLVINNIMHNNYFPIKPLTKLPKINAVFLNISLLSAWDLHVHTWEDLCHCNTYSLREKIDYIVHNQNSFLVDDESFEFLHNYLLVKYKLNLVKINISDFNADYKVCKLNYGS
jgi:hypothetical protein